MATGPSSSTYTLHYNEINNLCQYWQTVLVHCSAQLVVLLTPWTHCSWSMIRNKYPKNVRGDPHLPTVTFRVLPKTSRAKPRVQYIQGGSSTQCYIPSQKLLHNLHTPRDSTSAKDSPVNSVSKTSARPGPHHPYLLCRACA